MGNNITENGRKAADIKAKKRAEALRENLKRRKNSEAVRSAGAERDKDAKPENSQ